jgi:hypothetical protein
LAVSCYDIVQGARIIVVAGLTRSIATASSQVDACAEIQVSTAFLILGTAQATAGFSAVEAFAARSIRTADIIWNTRIGGEAIVFASKTLGVAVLILCNTMILHFAVKGKKANNFSAVDL